MKGGREFSADDMLIRLRRKYATPEWLFVSEFPLEDADEDYKGRLIDGLAFRLYRSRGEAVYCFEVKVDRKDWLRELADPAKAESAINVADRFYMVAPQEVIRLDELPDGWGLIVPHGDGLTVAKEAGQQPKRTRGYDFYSRIVKKAMRGLGHLEYQRGYEDGVKTSERRASELEVRVKSQGEAMGEANKLLGFHLFDHQGIDAWQLEHVKAAMEMVRRGGLYDRFRYLNDEAKRLVEHALETAATVARHTEALSRKPKP